MINNLKREACKALGALTKHKAVAELKERHDAAFSILHPQVKVVKRSPSVQIAMGTAIGGLILSGHVVPAVVVTSVWLGSKPLTHLAAGCVAGVGAVDAALVDAFGRLEAMHADEKPRSARRRMKTHPAPAAG